jgi:hypothetical protein
MLRRDAPQGSKLAKCQRWRKQYRFAPSTQRRFRRDDQDRPAWQRHPELQKHCCRLPSRPRRVPSGGGPRFTKSFAVANPIPSVPPVTTAILPSSFLVIFSVLAVLFFRGLYLTAVKDGLLRTSHPPPRARKVRTAARAASARVLSTSSRATRS